MSSRRALSRPRTRVSAVALVGVLLAGGCSTRIPSPPPADPVSPAEGVAGPGAAPGTPASAASAPAQSPAVTTAPAAAATPAAATPPDGRAARAISPWWRPLFVKGTVLVWRGVQLDTGDCPTGTGEEEDEGGSGEARPDAAVMADSVTADELARCEVVAVEPAGELLAATVACTVRKDPEVTTRNGSVWASRSDEDWAYLTGELVRGFGDAAGPKGPEAWLEEGVERLYGRTWNPAGRWYTDGRTRLYRGTLDEDGLVMTDPPLERDCSQSDEGACAGWSGLLARREGDTWCVGLTSSDESARACLTLGRGPTSHRRTEGKAPCPFKETRFEVRAP